MTNEKPLLAITMGDPAGIGPEIVLKALAHPDVYECCRPLVVGDRSILERASGWSGMPQLELVTIDSLSDLPGELFRSPGRVALLDLANCPAGQAPPGKVGATPGKAAVEFVHRACDLALEGRVEGVVTGPLNKEAMHLGGYAYAGHTELLAERTKTKKVSMLLVGPTLKVIHVSTHVSLRAAVERVTRARVGEVIGLAAECCRDFGVAAPRIAVAGLNPHAGESGLFGTEEVEEIAPAIEDARAAGHLVEGPVAPDTVFLRATRGDYDIVVAMYHDQGHIPMKLLAFDEGVNVTIGLPIIRVSVDHGTAFDIAGQGRARERSLVQAIRVASELSKARSVKTGAN